MTVLDDIRLGNLVEVCSVDDSLENYWSNYSFENDSDYETTCSSTPNIPESSLLETDSQEASQEASQEVNQQAIEGKYN